MDIVKNCDSLLTMMRTVALLALLPMLASAQADPRAIEDLRAGKRTTANAAWWGFNEEDSTEALQAAISSGARRVIVPNVGREWIVRPILLTGNQELILEPGVVIAAKRGEYRERGVSLLAARDVQNVTIRGYGATLRMNKQDYIAGLVLDQLKWDRYFGMYPKAEWRMTLTISGSTNVRVLGLALRDSGGDGIYIDGGKQRYSKDILLRDVVCDNHYRQGMSIISVDGLTVENSEFRNTWGTAPSAGVDIEPDSPEHRVRNVVFRHCAFTGNMGDGIEIFLAHLTQASGDVSILFDECRVSSANGSGIRVTKVGDTAPGGLIEFRNTTVEGTEGYGIKVQDKSADRGRVRFVNCTVRDAARSRAYKGAWTPVWIHAFRPELTARFGGVDFVNLLVEDERDRPAVTFESASPGQAWVDITGTIAVRNSKGLKTVMPKSVSLPGFIVKEVKD